MLPTILTAAVGVLVLFCLFNFLHTPGGTVHFIIRQGKHYCNHRLPRIVWGRELRFMARFDDSARYKTMLPVNQMDINKLYGFTDNKNSARLGWNYLDGRLYMYPYVHAGGHNYGAEDPAPICEVGIGQDILCSIRRVTGSYIFTVGLSEVIVSDKAIKNKGTRFQMFPYFGGDEIAPQDIHIFIQHLPSTK